MAGGGAGGTSASCLIRRHWRGPDLRPMARRTPCTQGPGPKLITSAPSVRDDGAKQETCTLTAAGAASRTKRRRRRARHAQNKVDATTAADAPTNRRGAPATMTEPRRGVRHEAPANATRQRYPSNAAPQRCPPSQRPPSPQNVRAGCARALHAEDPLPSLLPPRYQEALSSNVARESAASPRGRAPHPRGDTRTTSPSRPCRVVFITCIRGHKRVTKSPWPSPSSTAEDATIDAVGGPWAPASARWRHGARYSTTMSSKSAWSAFAEGPGNGTQRRGRELRLKGGRPPSPQLGAPRSGLRA